jgi:hypothetical protein
MIRLIRYPLPHRRALLFAALVVLAVAALSGCAAGDWLREPVSSADLAAAQQAHTQAVTALNAAQSLAERLDADQAAALIAQAQAAVDATAQAVAAVESDGAPRWLAGLGVVLTIVAAAAGGKAAVVAGTLSSIVEGIQRGRRVLTKDQRELLDNSLLNSTDDADRARVRKIKKALQLDSVT